MEVIILSKTSMGGRCCVGGMVLNSGQYVRLRNRGEYGQDCTDFEVRQIWDIDFETAHPLIPPHIEDVYINRKVLLRQLPQRLTIRDIVDNLNIPIWRGTPENLFEGMLNWTHSGSGYISHDDVPQHSVGFWISDRNIIKTDFEGNVRYNYRAINNRKSLKFVGTLNPIDIIPRGTLIRVSLAKWWSADNSPSKCWLQLSGWYDL